MGEDVCGELGNFWGAGGATFFFFFRAETSPKIRLKRG